MDFVKVKEEALEVKEEWNAAGVSNTHQAFGSVLSEVRNIYVINSKKDYDVMAKNTDNCQSYLRSGVCPDFSKCPYHHLRYENSPTVQIKNLFKHPILDKNPVCSDGENSELTPNSVGEEKRLTRDYKKFYENIITKFRAAGTIVMFKCCRNHDPH